ncbi:MAG: SDR family oxidoreductase [Steroidobacteraceae bacterium]
MTTRPIAIDHPVFRLSPGRAAHDLHDRRRSRALIKNDVSQEDQVQKLFEDVVSEFGRIDMAVNNAGISIETRGVE